jgi:hypothetical protein
MSMKNSNDTISNRTRDLPTCSTVPPREPDQIREEEKSRTSSLHGAGDEAPQAERCRLEVIDVNINKNILRAWAQFMWLTIDSSRGLSLLW